MCHIHLIIDWRQALYSTAHRLRRSCVGKDDWVVDPVGRGDADVRGVEGKRVISGDWRHFSPVSADGTARVDCVGTVRANAEIEIIVALVVLAVVGVVAPAGIAAVTVLVIIIAVVVVVDPGVSVVIAN